MKILSNLDLKQSQLLQAVIENRESAPLSPVAGQIYFNTVEGKFYGYTEARQWVDLSNIYDDSSIQGTINRLQELVGTKADQTDLTGLSEKVTTVEGKVSALEQAKDNSSEKIAELESGLAGEISRAKGEEARIEGLVTTEADRAKAEEGKIRGE